jgi:hypothetical protein
MVLKSYLKLNISFFLTFLFVLINSYGYNYNESFNINFDGVYFSDSIFKVYYDIDSYEEKELNSNLNIVILFNGSKINECSYNVNKRKEVKILKRIYCVIPSQGKGLYTFNVFIDQKNIHELKKSKYLDYDLNKSFFSTINFEDLEDNKTKVIINTFFKNISDLEDKDKLFRVKVNIPKEVISYLDENSKYLIESELRYKIIDPDPVIAWDVKSPKKIEYNITKKITGEDREKFMVEITEKKSFTYVKLFIVFIIVFIILITLFPIFKKNKKIKLNKK